MLPTLGPIGSNSVLNRGCECGQFIDHPSL
jgi:hypothetical protein